MEEKGHQLEALREAFLRSGKGRRPGLPHNLQKTNLLLYQLHLLRVEGKRSYKDVQKWFVKLFPGTSFPADRFEKCVTRVAQRVEEFEDEQEKQAFLARAVEFNLISEELNAVGVDREFDFGRFMKCELRTSMALDIYSYCLKEKKSSQFFHSVITALSVHPITLSSKDLWKKATSAHSTFRRLQKNRQRKPLEYKNFMEEPFLSFHPQSALPFVDQASVSLPEQDQACSMGQAVTDEPLFNATSHQPLQSQQQSSATDCKLPPHAAQHESSTAPEFVCSNFCPTFISTPVRGEVNINKKSFDQLRLQFSDTTEEVRLLKIQLDTVKQMYQDQQLKSEKLESENDKIKNDLKSLKSQNSTLLLEKKTFLASRAYKENCHLRSKVRTITSLLDSLKKKNGQLSNSVTFLQREKKKLQSDLSRLRKDKERLKRKREELDLDAVNQICKSSEFSTPSLRHGNRFTDAVRKAIIALQARCNVSGSQCSKVIQVVAKELFSIEWNLKDLPSQQTVRDISDEAHVLSKILSAEKLSLDNFTLHVDGTSRDQRKFMGHQVTLASGETLSLGFIDVATEDAATLLDVTIGILQELSDLHSPSESDVIFKEILSKLQCTMTDRASVMKKYAKDLNVQRQELLQDNSEIDFLHCNAHFLLGLSQSCESALKEIERSVERKLGRDNHSKFSRFLSSTETATSRFIRTACAVLGPRGDQKSGCRVEWLAFCEEQDIPVKLPSFRSNRFNCYFEAAAKLLQNINAVKMFLNGGFLAHENLLIDSVRRDAADDNLMTLVSALGVLFIYFTGPFWALIKSNFSLKLFPVCVQELERSLADLSQDPSPIFQPTYCTPISEKFPVDGALKDAVCLFIQNLSQANREYFINALKALLTSCSVVLRRQLSDFLPGGKFEKLPEHLTNCPLTNLVGENAFGDFDFQKSKHRNASLFHHSTIHMAKHNHVDSWLNAKPAEESALLMQDARKSAKKLRHKHRLREKEVVMAVRQKMLENAAAQQEKLQKAAETKKELIKNVIAHGGPCSSPADVRRLQKALSASEYASALKNEVRYQKLVLGLPGALKLSKPADDLAKDLICHLQDCNASSFDMDLAEFLENEDEAELWQGEFKFSNIGAWVAVYYDDNFYIGQVLNILNPLRAEVKFVEQTKVKEDCFRWPRTDDIAAVDAKFVFGWDFDLAPVSNNCRIWQVDCISSLKQSYNRIKAGSV